MVLYSDPNVVVYKNNKGNVVVRRKEEKLDLNDDNIWYGLTPNKEKKIKHQIHLYQPE
jgi:hypothetical protein